MRPHWIAILVLFCNLAACTTWHAQTGISPVQFISANHPRVVRLTRADSSHLVLHQPRIVAGDSLAGVDNGKPSSVPASDVTEVAIPRVSPGRTLGLILALQALGAIIVMATGGLDTGCC